MLMLPTFEEGKEMSGILKNIPLDIGDLCLSTHGNLGSGLLMTFGKTTLFYSWCSQIDYEIDYGIKCWNQSYRNNEHNDDDADDDDPTLEF